MAVEIMPAHSDRNNADTAHRLFCHYGFLTWGNFHAIDLDQERPGKMRIAGYAEPAIID